MNVILCVGVISVLFAYQAKFPRYRTCLLFSFAILACFLAVRYDFGNDYIAYMQMHEELQQESIFDTYYESGWVVVNKLFFNFYILVASLSVFNCFIYFKFINKYVPSDFWWIALFIYVFNTNFMLIQSSAMRQTVAILIFIYSIKFILNKAFWKYIIACLVASTFHSSAILLLPVYWVSKISFNTVFTKLILVIIFISIYIGGHYLLPTIRSISLFVFRGRYDHFFLEESDVFSLNACVYSIMLIILVFFDSKFTPTVKIFNRISIIALFFFPIASIFPMAARVGYYFFPATLVTYPYVYKLFNSKLLGRIFLLCLMCTIVIRFYSITHSDIWREHFVIYKTIFNE